MAKYKFRLATLQRLREVRRDQQRASLAEAFFAEQLLAEKRAEIVQEEIGVRELQRSANEGKYLDINRLLEAQRYELLLKARVQELDKQQLLLAAETERRRQLLVEADRDVRAMELLDERQRREHEIGVRRVETKMLDEVAMIQRNRS